MKHAPDSRFAAFVGIDWADAKHDICLRAADSDNDEYAVIPHTPEAIQDWALSLQRRFNSQPIAVCLELNKGPLVARLAPIRLGRPVPRQPQVPGQIS